MRIEDREVARRGDWTPTDGPGFSRAVGGRGLPYARGRPPVSKNSHFTCVSSDHSWTKGDPKFLSEKIKCTSLFCRRVFKIYS